MWDVVKIHVQYYEKYLMACSSLIDHLTFCKPALQCVFCKPVLQFVRVHTCACFYVTAQFQTCFYGTTQLQSFAMVLTGFPVCEY